MKAIGSEVISGNGKKVLATFSAPDMANAYVAACGLPVATLRSICSAAGLEPSGEEHELAVRVASHGLPLQ